MATRLSEVVVQRTSTTTGASTIVDVLQQRAASEPDRVGYVFLRDGDAGSESITYSELDRQARRLASRLRHLGAAGERVLLLLHPGLGYVVGLFASWYAGAIAVPIYPPIGSTKKPRVSAIALDSQAAFALTAPDAHQQNCKDELACVRHWISIGSEYPLDADSHSRPHPNAPALLQYTSGTTADPKGVIVLHRNLIANSIAIRDVFGLTPEDRSLIWLPPYHDMGLIGGVLQPAFTGFPVTLFSPGAFLERPLRWLELMARTKATVSGGPNFAYELCARLPVDGPMDGLDLESWRVAFNGAEPIRQSTIERFSLRFERCGFRRAAFHPCYGLAEATLLVSGGRLGDPSPKSESSSQRPASGRVIAGHSVRIVDSSTRQPRSPDQEGEIWVSGPSVAAGYWGRPEDSRVVFDNWLGDEGPFLLTGDSGTISDGRLTVTGRIKDIIIIHGRNHYPQDIESTVVGAHPHIRPDAAAALSIQEDGEEFLMVVAEVQRHVAPSTYQNIIRAVRQAIYESHELNARVVVLIKAGRLPRTTSGKVRRSLCREKYLNGTLDAITVERTPMPVEGHAEPKEWELREIVAKVLRIPAADVDFSAPLSALGLDSLAAVELKREIEVRFGRAVPLSRVLDGPTVDELARDLGMYERVQPQSVPLGNRGSEQYPLSIGQKALWFLNKVKPEDSAYHLAIAVCIEAELDEAALERAFLRISERHSALRTTFGEDQGKPFQRVHDRMSPSFSRQDVSDWTDSRIRQRLTLEVERPFDLKEKAPLRVLLLVRSRREYYLLVAVHHIVSDLWSMAILTRDLATFYAAERIGLAAEFPPLKCEYGVHVERQRQMLSSEEGERMWRYWRTQVSPDLPALNLLLSPTRKVQRTSAGASEPVMLGRATVRALRAFAASHSVTPYAILLTAYQILLHRYTGQREIAVGSPTAGRLQPEFSDMFGFFINLVVIVGILGGSDTFGRLVDRTRCLVKGALENQEYPFAVIVERMQPPRDQNRTPLFQTMFTYERVQTEMDPVFAALALGEEGTKMQLADLSVRSVKLSSRATPFELSLAVAQNGNETLAGSLRYSTDLFEAVAMRRLVRHFEMLVQKLLRSPDLPIAALSLLTQTETAQLTRARHGPTSTHIPECAHVQFERQARATPSAIAIVGAGGEITYSQLNRRAQQMADRLRKLGVGPDVPVAIALDRSIRLPLTILAIWKAGGAYVPLDPDSPGERICRMVLDCGARFFLTEHHRVGEFALENVATLSIEELDRGGSEQASGVRVDPANLAYVIYTSGSTGEAKGVMITHANVSNFLTAMDERIGGGPAETLLAATNASFDISVLEMFWSLTRGMRLVISTDAAATASRRKRLAAQRTPVFSLFYFASPAEQREGYRLVREGARFADRAGFAAVWTPERHFHEFGGLFPNPAIMGAALAGETQRVQVRAGSVVLPLHHPLRIAEEWSVVDNLSNGRVGVAFASGWHADDFVFAPAKYEGRKDEVFEGIESVQRLWRGETVELENGAGKIIPVRVYPRPVQRELPTWVTSGGTTATFVRAGEIGANVLTHLLGQTVPEVAEKIRAYREARASRGYDPTTGCVTLMLHTYVGTSESDVVATARRPFREYLRSSIDLIGKLAKTLDRPTDLSRLSAPDMEVLLDIACSRYFGSNSALLGTRATCIDLVEQLDAIGVDEIACLIDFGIATDRALTGLENIKCLWEDYRKEAYQSCDDSLEQFATKYSPTLFQCTPSRLRMLLADSARIEPMKGVRTWMVGGEPLPADLAEQITKWSKARVLNMYGPTETTIWSTTAEVRAGRPVTLGLPILNTTVDVLDTYLQRLPDGVPGELCIGGAGLARGYLGRPDLTAEAFVPDPFSAEPGARMYRTGDLVRRSMARNLDFIGRRDHQIKIRGYRVELGEIERALRLCREVRDAVVVATADTQGCRLIGYVLPSSNDAVDVGGMRVKLRKQLPEYMIPHEFVLLDRFPLTSTGKIDRTRLPEPGSKRQGFSIPFCPPANHFERVIANVWRQVLQKEVSTQDNFFDLGGHSLLLAEVQSRLRDEADLEIPLVKLFEYPTVADLASFVAGTKEFAPPVKSIAERAAKQREAASLRSRRASPESSGGITP